MSEYTPTRFQNLVCMAPDDVDLFLGGGRGGGKSYALAFLLLKHAVEHGSHARALYLRQTYPGLTDFEAITRELFTIADPGARYNAQTHLWKFSNGATLELGQLTNEGDYQKYQGRSFTLIAFDECGQFADLRLIDRMRSNLRAPKGVPVRMVLAANPGGPGHAAMAKRFVFKQTPWHPFTDSETGAKVIYCPSTYRDNTGLDRDSYRRQLEASCVGDAELLRAWTDGDWSVVRGAYFAGVLDEKRNAADIWPELPTIPLRFQNMSMWECNQLAKRVSSIRWNYFLSHDFGVAAPSATYLVAESPGDEGPDGRYYPRGSLILVDELATHETGNLTKGLGWTVPQLAEEIRAFCTRWGVRPSGCADDAIFARTGSGAGSIAEEFRKHGVHFSPARKADRWTGWELMRRMLQAAGSPDQPGLYISRSCSYFWQTVPYLPRDDRRIDDVDTKGPDHAADTVRYACVYRSRNQAMSQMTIRRAS